jgi:hypothetical protein
VVGDARRFVELRPVQEVLLDGVGKLPDKAAQSDVMHQAGHGRYVYETGHGVLLESCSRLAAVGRLFAQIGANLNGSIWQNIQQYLQFANSGLQSDKWSDIHG